METMSLPRALRIEVVEAVVSLLARLNLPEHAEACHMRGALERGAEPAKAQVDAIATALAEAWMHASVKGDSPRAPSKNSIRAIFDEFERLFSGVGQQEA